MSDLVDLLRAKGEPIGILEALTGLSVYPRSLVSIPSGLVFLAHAGAKRSLGLLMQGDVPPEFQLQVRPASFEDRALRIGLGETDHGNALALRAHVPFTAPIRVGLHKSAGWGDRLGIATPGHVRAMRHARGIVPIFAQQSIREMERTARTPEDVMDDASWGVLQEGWQAGFGADADHLKNEQDIDVCVSAGFVMYTLDPRDHVDNEAETDGIAELRRKYAALPWERLETTPEATHRAYAGKSWRLTGGEELSISEEHLLRAACKYGRALAHLVSMYRYLVSAIGSRPFELEVSVDETDTPTKPEEHFYIASELRHLGVEWVSLAPRYVGRFEKGVDYIGDLGAFEDSFRRHVAVARYLGPYKLSLHSGSDKFSIYPIAARLAGEWVHLKTAGTSYLEALRAISRINPELFREIYRFALDHYEEDRRSYHVSAEMSRAPRPEAVEDAELDTVLDQFDARQALHVTFGTVLTIRESDGTYRFRDRIYAALTSNEEAHYAALEKHILRHLQPFNS
ncbi:MAG: hypothetical protein JXA74_10410 [Anaerolineae bacterium]|nr:hypothetical protein [Anaerolineae bacterium]